jgi:hypothetical protein
MYKNVQTSMRMNQFKRDVTSCRIAWVVIWIALSWSIRIWRNCQVKSKEESDFPVSAKKLEVYDRLCVSEDPKTSQSHKLIQHMILVRMTVHFRWQYHISTLWCTTPCCSLRSTSALPNCDLFLWFPRIFSYPDFKLQTYKSVSGDDRSCNASDVEQFTLCINLVRQNWLRFLLCVQGIYTGA